MKTGRMVVLSAAVQYDIKSAQFIAGFRFGEPRFLMVEEGGDRFLVQNHEPIYSASRAFGEDREAAIAWVKRTIGRASRTGRIPKFGQKMQVYGLDA